MLTIRPETPKDAKSIRYVNEQAFGRAFEAGLVEKLRSRRAHVLSLVATDGGQIVGHIAGFNIIFSLLVIRSVLFRIKLHFLYLFFG